MWLRRNEQYCTKLLSQFASHHVWHNGSFGKLCNKPDDTIRIRCDSPRIKKKTGFQNMVGTFEYEFFRGDVHFFWTAFCSKWTAKSCFSPKSVFELQLHQQWVIWTAKSPIRRQILRRFQIRCRKHHIFSESWENLEKPTNFFRCVCSFFKGYIHTRFFKTNFIFVFPTSDMTQKSKLRPLAPLNA